MGVGLELGEQRDLAAGGEVGLDATAGGGIGGGVLAADRELGAAVLVADRGKGEQPADDRADGIDGAAAGELTGREQRAHADADGAGPLEECFALTGGDRGAGDERDIGGADVGRRAHAARAAAGRTAEARAGDDRVGQPIGLGVDRQAPRGHRCHTSTRGAPSADTRNTRRASGGIGHGRQLGW